MVDMLRAVSKQPVVYVEYPGAQHAFDVFSGNRTDAAVAGVERFLNVARGEAGQHVDESAGEAQPSSTT